MRPPALVLGWIPRIVAVIARSLNRHGIQVDVADLTLERPVRSRAIRQFSRLPNPDIDPDGFFRALADLIQRRGYSVLIPTNDQAFTAVLRHYNELQSMVHLACPPPYVAKRVLDKSAAIENARNCGLDVPRTAIASHSAEFAALSRTFPFPWVLKPAEKQSQLEEFKNCTIRSPSDLAARFPDSRPLNPPLLVQEYCRGVGLGIEVLMHRGECVAVFQHRRLKELPHTGGYAVMAVAEEPDPVLLNLSLKLLRTIEWEGVAMVEFRVDPKDGRAVFMEINGRYWGSLSLPVLAGLDFPLYHWQLLHDETVAVPSCYRVGTKWRWTTGYLVRLHWLLWAASQSGTARRTLYHDLLQVHRDFSSSVQDPLFDGSDPMAGLFELIGTIRDVLAYDVKAMLRRANRERHR